MQSSIYLITALVVFIEGKQLDVGPQVFSEPQTSLTSSQKLDKRYVTQEYTLYLTPDEIKALTGFKSAENEKTQSDKKHQSEEQNQEKQQLKWYNSQFIPETPQLEIRGLGAHNAFFQKQKTDLEIQQGQYSSNLYPEEITTEQPRDIQSLAEKVKHFENYYNWQKNQEENTNKESKLENDAKWKPYYTVVAKNEENILSNENHKQQWNRILDHNRAQLKLLSKPKQSQELKENDKFFEQKPLNTKSDIEKEIENILRDHRAYELQQNSGVSLPEAINQRPPILIHKEVSVTKHLPVPFVKKVRVSVPTPVLVPVPEPYEVKIPHPYPVLYKF